MVRCLPFQVTVYGGLNTLAYSLQCLRERDVHFSTNLGQLSHANPPVHDGIAIWADPYKVSTFRGNGLIFRHVTRRQFRGAAADAVHFTRTARSFVSCPASQKKCGEVMAQDQHRPFVVAGLKSSLHPLAHGVFVNTEEPGDLLYRVAAVDFD